MIGGRSRHLRVDVSGLAPGGKLALESETGRKILLCNVGGTLYAIENQCSHAAVELTEGTLEGCELECRFHGAVFDVRNGRALALPARRDLRSYPVSREGDVAVIELSGSGGS
jgi:nitrite reductase/ring-hydroxylating ferredoxin subunit